MKKQQSWDKVYRDPYHMLHFQFVDTKLVEKNSSPHLVSDGIMFGKIWRLHLCCHMQLSEQMFLSLELSLICLLSFWQLLKSNNSNAEMGTGKRGLLGEKLAIGS